MTQQSRQQAIRPPVTLWRQRGGRVDLRGLCATVQVTFTLDPPVQWWITLVPSQGPSRPVDIELLDTIFQTTRPNDLVSIGIETPGGMCLGLVDSINRQVTRTGTVNYSLVLQGSGLVGKALQRDNILLSLLEEKAAQPFFDHLRAVYPQDPETGLDHPILLGLPSALGPRADSEQVVEGANPKDKGVNLFTGKTVREVVNWIVTDLPLMRSPILERVLGGSGLIGDYIALDTITTWNDQRIYSEHPQNYSGNLLGFVRAVIDADFYEVFESYVPNGTELPECQLVVRPKPFDEPVMEWLPVQEEPGIDWSRLQTRVTGRLSHEIDRQDIHGEQQSITDAQAFAYYTVSASHELIGNPEQHKLGLKYPTIDTYNAVQFGAGSYETRLTLIASDVSAAVDENLDYEGEIPVEVREFRNRLLNWYRLNPWFVTGSVVITGREEIRAGDPVYFRDLNVPYGDEQGFRAYAVAVTHAWSFGSIYTTTIQFTRGHTTTMVQEIRDIIAEDAARFGVDPNHLAEG